MTSRHLKLITLAAVVLLAAGGGYLLYPVSAVQGQGTLAQAPMNIQTVVPPSFIMAVDDSGSMLQQLLLPGKENTGSTDAVTGHRFFLSPGRLRGGGRLYANVLADGQQTAGATFPPLDVAGFARSPKWNAQYYNPAIDYVPWKNADGSTWPNSPITAAKSNPRSSAADRHYDLTREEDRTNWNVRIYDFRPNMVLPQGMWYYVPSSWHPNGCGGLADATTVNTWIEVTNVGGKTILATPDDDVGGSCKLHVKTLIAVVYLSPDTPAPAGFNMDNAITIVDPTGPGTLIKYELRSANFNSTAAYNAQIQNFANWYTYYGNRNRAMVASLTHALYDVDNMNVGYFGINMSTGNRPGLVNGNVVMRDMASNADKTLLFADMVRLTANGGTPSRSATVKLGDEFMRRDSGAPIRHACQVNAGMLFTDGYTNESPSGGYGNRYRPFGDTDHSGGEPRPIAGNPNPNTIADIAYHFYRTNLRDDLPAGRVPVDQGCATNPQDPRLDCNPNPHMKFYGITLGTIGQIYKVDLAATEDPYTHLPNWSVTGTQNGSPRNVDDIWHATINTRGEKVNAQSPIEVTNAMRRILAAVMENAAPSGSIAVSGARIGAGSLAVAPYYEARKQGTDWFSYLRGSSVSSDPLTGEVTLVERWEAAGKLPAHGARNIWFGRGHLAPEEFKAANIDTLEVLCDNPSPGQSLCTGPELAALGGSSGGISTPITVANAVDYLRGDPTLAPASGGKLRYRSERLGDIVNSTPVISSPRDDYGYRSLPGTLGTGYSTYLAAKASRRPMVYAGANDGMLHAFDGGVDTQGGVEKFAFIPQSVLGFTGNLLFPHDEARGGDQKFKHRYYVDGPVTVSDAYSSGWKTMLVGTTGAGARGAFGLDITAVASGNSFDAGHRLWEVSDLNTDLSESVRQNIGHVLGRPVIVPIKTGSGTGPVKWRAVFGNGYNSVSKKAVLYLVDMQGSPNITMIEATESGAPAGDNGLGNIVVVDRWAPNPLDGNALSMRGADGFADTVYAADQKGALWKFDLRNASPPSQTVPVFTTHRYTSGPESGTRQPILGGLTASAGPGGGVMVFFGTGAYSFVGDPVDETMQSLYAVLDNSTATPASTLTRTNLLQQSVIATTSPSDGRVSRTTTNHVPSAAHRGWYMDLPAGERFVGYPRVESGVVFMPTFVANATVDCFGASSNWLYGLNTMSGGAALSNVRYDSPTGSSPGAGTGAVGLLTDGTSAVRDVGVWTAARVSPLGAGADEDDLAAALAAQCSMVVQVEGAPLMYLPRACGRQSWRQIR